MAGAATAVRSMGFFLLPMLIFALLLLPVRSATQRLVMLAAALVPFLKRPPLVFAWFPCPLQPSALQPHLQSREPRTRFGLNSIRLPCGNPMLATS